MSFTKYFKMFALVDCNNFYASCERVFSPKLRDVPVVVLSNNDGCVIARCDRAKELGVPMGCPFFECRELVDRHKMVVCSSNYSLYGDMSSRVMNILSSFVPDFEIYSIDEAFLDFNFSDLEDKAKVVKETVEKYTGIPVSIGIAPTKTLAKLANYLAKKKFKNQGYFIIDASNLKEVTSQFPVEEIWGIGRQYAKKLELHGVRFAADLANKNDSWIRNNMSVIGLRTAYELRGIPCFSLDNSPPSKKSITSSRSFGTFVTSVDMLCEATSSYIAKAAEKLRSQHSFASAMYVNLFFHPFRSGQNCAKIVFPEPTNYTPEMIKYGEAAVRQLFVERAVYRKSGVILDGIVPEPGIQRDLFNQNDREMQRKRMELLDAMNQKNKTVWFASEGISKPWKMRCDRQSPKYTTKWKELLTIHV